MAISKFYIPNFLNHGSSTPGGNKEKSSINCSSRKRSTCIPSETFVDLARFNEIRDDINFKYKSTLRILKNKPSDCEERKANLKKFKVHLELATIALECNVKDFNKITSKINKLIMDFNDLNNGNKVYFLNYRLNKILKNIEYNNVCRKDLEKNIMDEAREIDKILLEMQ